MAEKIKKKRPGRPENLVPFKKGHKKIGGRTKDPLGVRQLKKYTKEVMATTIAELLDAPQEKLLEIAHAPNSTGLRAALALAIWRADWSEVNSVMERVIGKVPQRLEGADGKPLIPPAPPQIIYVAGDGHEI